MSIYLNRNKMFSLANTRLYPSHKCGGFTLGGGNKIIKPSFKIKNQEALKNSLKTIKYAARISHRSEEKQTENSAENFIRKVVIEHGDWSVVEHAMAQVELVVDRGIQLELVRHRLFSYTAESTRFVSYEKREPSFIYPIPETTCIGCLSGQELICGTQDWFHIDSSSMHKQVCAYSKEWLDSIDNCLKTYHNLLTKN
ncbi:Thymidylate synthase ThyX [uncultured archaeon]|nr:Thymidylate synthase ThyX [uncultured archaeon]